MALTLRPFKGTDMIFSFRTIIVGTLSSAIASFPLYAQNSCNVELTSQVTINNNTIEFFDKDNHHKSLYKIENNKHLFIKGSTHHLNTEQQQLVTNYSHSVRSLVPEVQAVVIEGVDLAIDGVNLAFNGLLGEGNALADNLTSELAKIRDEALSQYSIEQGFSVGGAQDELKIEQYEQRIESIVEKTVMNSMGSILIALGQQMLSSDGQGENFETRMEKFGETMEAEMEKRAEQIEQKAQALCQSIKAVDKLEEQLKFSINELAQTDVINIKYTKS